MLPESTAAENLESLARALGAIRFAECREPVLACIEFHGPRGAGLGPFGSRLVPMD
ncbi:MAG TPA: hypothetical protein VG142_02655 [Trebonia sp.]|nr:hypothetical protein [Trebonia sp.]